MHEYVIFFCMKKTHKTTMNLDISIIKKAMEATGVNEKTALVHMGLEELIRKAVYKHLINFGGTDPHAKVPLRKKRKDLK